MEYKMYVDDNLYVQVGQERMNQAMRCSIHALNVVMGGPDPKARPNPTDLDKFLREPVGNHCQQVGYVVNTHRMIVMIPEGKRKAMVKVLSTTWGEATPPFLHIDRGCKTAWHPHFPMLSLQLGNLPVHELISSHV
jgi:hypothetical protein